MMAEIRSLEHRMAAEKARAAAAERQAQVVHATLEAGGRVAQGSTYGDGTCARRTLVRVEISSPGSRV